MYRAKKYYGVMWGFFCCLFVCFCFVLFLSEGSRKEKITAIYEIRQKKISAVNIYWEALTSALHHFFEKGMPKLHHLINI